MGKLHRLYIVLRRALRAVLRWLRQPKNAIASFLFLLTLPGLLDDTSVWIRWINTALGGAGSRLHVDWLLTIMDTVLTGVADFLASDIAPYVALGLALFIFEIRKVKLFVRWALSRLRYAMVAATDGTQFISKPDAVKVIRGSRWAMSRQRRTEKMLSLSESLAKAFAAVDPAERERIERFTAWCGIALETFRSERPPSSVRQSEDGEEYDEIVLRSWLDDRYDTDLIAEFGST